MMTSKKIILASTSQYRKSLIEKLVSNVVCQKPICDEETLKNKFLTEGQNPIQIAHALSYEKGLSVFKNNPDCIVISGDQLINFEGQIIGKSNNFENAQKQLKLMNGKTHQLVTCLTVFSQEHTTYLDHISKMTLKKLNAQEIDRYLSKDQPFDSAGSYKIECSGVGLFEKIETNDFTAIQGLPLLWLSKTLRKMGYELFN